MIDLLHFVRATLAATEIDDIHADSTLTVVFIIALVAAVLFYHAPRRIARLADYFAALGLPIGYQGYFRWWQEGLYRGVKLKVECGSAMRASGPLALVATIQFSEDLHVDTRALLPEGTTVFAYGPGHLCFRLPEELHETNSAYEPLRLIDRLIDLDPNAEPGAATLPADAYPFRPWRPLPLLISLAGGFGAAWCAYRASFFTAGLVLAATLLTSVILSNLRNQPGTLASRRAWAWQVAIAMALCILGLGLIWTRYGWLGTQDFARHPVGGVVEIPHHGIRLQAYRELERGQGQIGPGGAVLGNSLLWQIHDRDGKLLEDGRITLNLGEFDWIAPNWDDGQKMFILGIVKDYDSYQALTLQPIGANGVPGMLAPDASTTDSTGTGNTGDTGTGGTGATGGPTAVVPNGLTPPKPTVAPTPAQGEAPAADNAAYQHWLLCKPSIPPNTALAQRVKERIKLETQQSQTPTHN